MGYYYNRTTPDEEYNKRLPDFKTKIENQILKEGTVGEKEVVSIIRRYSIYYRYSLATLLLMFITLVVSIFILINGAVIGIISTIAFSIIFFKLEKIIKNYCDIKIGNLIGKNKYEIFNSALEYICVENKINFTNDLINSTRGLSKRYIYFANRLSDLKSVRDKLFLKQNILNTLNKYKFNTLSKKLGHILFVPSFKIYNDKKKAIQIKNIKQKRILKKINFDILNKYRNDLGLAGEKFVLAMEKDMLIENKRKDLADKVELMSEKSDSYGYDIKSFSVDGEEINIEVKTTNGDWDKDFYLTQNEMDTMEKSKRYKLYRIYNVKENVSGTIADVKIFNSLKDIRKKFQLKPTQYVATKM